LWAKDKDKPQWGLIISNISIMQYDQTGFYVGLAGIAVGILAGFGINTNVQDVGSIISAVLIIVGMVKQFIAHRNLAIAAGVHPSVTK